MAAPEPRGLGPRLQRGVQWLAGRSLNPAAVAVLRLGLPLPPYGPEGALVLEHFGRRSGRRRLTPLGCLQESPGRLLVVAEHGRRADWLRNALAAGVVRVWRGGRPYRARVSVVEEADPQEILARAGAVHAAAVRLMAHDPCVVAVDLLAAP